MYSSIYVPILAKEISIPSEESHMGFKRNDNIIIEFEGEEENAIFIQSIEKPTCKKEVLESVKIIRKCTKEDEEVIVNNIKESKDCKPTVASAVKQLELELSISSIDISFNQKKLLIIFTADARVDFRALVRILAGTFKKKIHLLQIGARDKAQLIKGYGTCGRELCCTNQLKDIPSVTMDAPREQNIAFKGSESLSGCCGKLKCCLNYEAKQYKELKIGFPKFGSKINIEDKKYVIIGMDILNKTIKLKSDYTYITLSLEEFNAKKK